MYYTDSRLTRREEAKYSVHVIVCGVWYKLYTCGTNIMFGILVIFYIVNVQWCIGLYIEYHTRTED